VVHRSCFLVYQGRARSFAWLFSLEFSFTSLGGAPIGIASPEVIFHPVHRYSVIKGIC